MTTYSRLVRFVLRNRLWFVLFAVGLAGLAWAASIYVPPNTVHLRNDGFHPEKLIIEPGETVTFVNKSSHIFWPASNAHPQHDQLTEFDAGQPLAQGKSWSFTFNQNGKWGYHDHIRSYYTGVVYVGKESLTYNCLDHLNDPNASGKSECWNETLQELLRNEGAVAAFNKFAEFYASDPDFATSGCHSIAHKLGDVAYGEVVRHGNDTSRLEFPPESLYCGYGYYHGILEHMIRDNPDFSKADAFCKKLITEYEPTVPLIKANCYHAIGHGFIPEPSDVESWGNPHTLPEPALVACRNLEDSELRSECMQGAFNVVADWMWNNQFGLKFPEVDSLSLCRSFDDREVSTACYYELSMKILPYSNNDIRTVYEKYVASIEDDKTATMIMNSAVAGLVGTFITRDDFIPFLLDCRALPERVRVGCLNGITGAFVAHGEPEKEYVKALAFCGDPVLTEGERSKCYSNIFRTFRGSYTKEKVAELCLQIDEGYRDSCEREI